MVFGIGGVAVVAILATGLIAVVSRLIEAKPFLAVVLLVWGVATALLAGVI